MMRLYATVYTTVVLGPAIVLACAFPFALNNFVFAKIIGLFCLYWLLAMMAMTACGALAAVWFAFKDSRNEHANF